MVEERYFPEITKAFLLALKENIVSAFSESTRRFGLNDSIFDGEEAWINVGGTIGYARAFTQTCSEFDMNDLSHYYDSLSWDESDRFDSEITNLAIKLGVIKPMEVEIEVNETGVSLQEEK